MIRAAVLAALLAGPAVAQEAPMSGEEFEAYVEGRTIRFALPTGESFGIERYLPDRRVIWSPLDGTCLDGRWFDDGPLICFAYDGDPEAKCWRVYDTDAGLRAEWADPPGATVLFEQDEPQAPLICGDLLS